jgi:NADH-quinone oxidoreductase subunit K
MLVSYNATLLQTVLFGSLIYSIGVYGIVVNRRNPLMLLMATELALLGLALNFSFVSIFLMNPFGQVYALLILIAAAAESSIGLALVILWYRATGNLSILDISQLKS